MAVMARILAAGSFSQSIPEVGHQKLISQYIHRELCEADEANLLDEDMHVYGLMPMEDASLFRDRHYFIPPKYSFLFS